MDRFQNLEEYVRRSAPSPERDAESSLPDDASMTDEQLDALDAMGDEAETGLFDVDQVRTKKEAWAAIDTNAKETAHYERAPHEYTVTVDE